MVYIPFIRTWNFRELFGIIIRFRYLEVTRIAQMSIPLIQGDQKNVPPLPGRDEKSSRKTGYSIFKYNLFRYYLENFVKNLQN